MVANPANGKLASLHSADHEPGVYRFRVFYIKVNGRRSVVAGWRLHETMRGLKLLHMYSKLEKLGDGDRLQFNATVHGTPLAVDVLVGTWQVRLGTQPAAAAA